MHDNLEAARLSIKIKTYDSKEIRDLPLPVQKYFSAVLKDGETNISLLFNFNKIGLIETVQAASRMRMVGDTMVATPWECRLGNYELRDEILVPQEGEIGRASCRERVCLYV